MAVFLFISCSCFSFSASAQKRITISGYVTDSVSGEKLVGAAVFDKLSRQGTTTNHYGFYSLSLHTGPVEIVVQFVGLLPATYTFNLLKDTVIHISMGREVHLNEVIISAEKNVVENTQMSVISVPVAQIKSIPPLLGEVDVIRVIQLLPGVQSGAEGTTGFYVRGGAADQNLILLDGVPLYNVSHLFGFFSAFNADALSTVDLVKGGFPARYGGRLSSVLDVRMKEGNMNGLKAEGSIGIIASRLTLDGPLKKGKSSFMLSGRRTYIDLLAAPIIRMAVAIENDGTSQAKAGYYFHDYNAKVNYIFSDKNRLYLSGYWGDDKAYMRLEDTYNNYNDKYNFALGWGNIATALRWNHLFNPKLFLNTTLSYSKFKFRVNYSEEYRTIQPPSTEGFKANYFSGIEDLSGKLDFDFLPNPKHSIKFGSHYIFHTFNPGATGYRANFDIESFDTSITYNKVFGTEVSAYIEDDIKISEKFKINTGLHLSGFWVKNKFYNSLQPRFSGRYLLNEKWALKSSFASMTQYMHLLSNNGIGLPTDLWVPATDKIAPQRSWQTAFGTAHSPNADYEFSVEVYYKLMKNMIEYKDGASYLNSDKDWQDLVHVGTGKAYGAEFFIQKKTGKTTGWLGYTLSWATRHFDSLNFGNAFYARYDRRHDIGLVVSHKFSNKFDFAFTWVYGTGNAVSLPTVRYSGMIENNSRFLQNRQVNFYEQRNNFRMAAYHRLDIGFNFHKEKSWGTRTWSLGAYNAYSRQNPFFYLVGTDYNNPPYERKLLQISLFPIIPSVSYRFTRN